MRSLYVTKLCTAAVIAVQLRSCCAILPVCLKDKRKTIQRNLICLALEQLIFFLSVTALHIFRMSYKGKNPSRSNSIFHAID